VHEQLALRQLGLPEGPSGSMWRLRSWDAVTGLKKARVERAGAMQRLGDGTESGPH
jgi:hypothetical protein